MLFQWLGVVSSVKVIESGAGWTNAYIVVSDVDPVQYLLSNLRAIADSGRLPSFAVTSDEVSFFEQNRVSMPSNASFGVDASGYNSGNYLLSLCFVVC